MNNLQSEMEQLLKDISILALTRQFSEKYYPLQTSFSSDTTEWSWGLAPLPWKRSYEKEGPAPECLPCKGGGK